MNIVYKRTANGNTHVCFPDFIGCFQSQTMSVEHEQLWGTVKLNTCRDCRGLTVGVNASTPQWPTNDCGGASVEQRKCQV